MKLALLGDIAIFDNGMLRPGWEQRLHDVEKILAKHDLVIANLEVPITKMKSTHVCKGVHLKTDERVVEILKFLHIKAVSLANNHICDFGIAGMDETMQVLEKADISFYGVNNKNWLFKGCEQRLNFHGFCCYRTNGAKYIEGNRIHGVCPLTKTAVIDALQHDKEDGFLSVLSLHWGDEYSQLPNENQVAIIHELAKEYCFILHGHHAHVMQGIESVDGTLAVYNQGNFCFDECCSTINPNLIIRQSEQNKEGFIVSVELVNNQIESWNSIGIHYSKDGVQIIDNTRHIVQLSEQIKNCNTVKYIEESRKMVINQKKLNLPRHDLRWIVSKVNYYSVGAKINSLVNHQKYLRAMQLKS